MSKRFFGPYPYLWISIGFFLIALAYKYTFVTIKNTPQLNAQTVTSRLRDEIATIEPVIKRLSSVIEEHENPPFNALLLEANYPYYIFSNRRIIFWSNNLFEPKYRDVVGDFKVAFIDISKGKYVIRKEQILMQKRLFEIVFLIPLEEKSVVTNEYLKDTYNERLFTDSNIEIEEISDDPEYQEIRINGKALFMVKFGTTYSNVDRQARAFIIVFILLSFIFAGIFIKKQLDVYVHEKSENAGFIFLLSCILIIRSLMLLTRFPFNFVYIDLFDPKYYASSMVNPSLGDLLLNLISLGLLGFYLFNYFLRSRVVRNILNGKKSTQTLVAAACIFLSFFWLAVHHQTMKTLNNDSQWSMDITQNLEFHYLKIVGFIIFIISVVIYFLFAHVSVRLYIQLVRENGRQFFVSLAGGVLLYVLFSILLGWEFLVVLVVNLLFFMILRFFELPRYIGKIQFLTFIYFFAFGLPTAIIGLYANVQYDRNTTNYNKSRLADQLLLESDFFTEQQLKEAARKIKNDIFIKERIVDPFASKLIIDKRIRREYLNNLDKFNIDIGVFNSRGEPFDQFNIKGNYHDIKSKLAEFQTDSTGLYFINQARGQPAIIYREFIEIEARGQVLGYVLLDLTQKRLVPNSVFPILLNDNFYTQQIEPVNQFSYGVFNNQGELQYNSGEFNYRKNYAELNSKSDVLFDRGVLIRGYNHKAFKGEGNKIVIVSSKQPSLGARLSNFSFLFLIYIFSILLILIAVTFYQSIKQIKLNYATKIQLYLNFAFFTPLIIISATTVSIIIQTFKTSLEDQYLEYAQNLSAEISGPLGEYRNLAMEPEDLSEKVFQIADIADLDVNVFINGRLRFSSLMQIYQNEILSNNIEPRAQIKIMDEQESAFIQEEHVGLLKYKNVYVGIRSYDTGTIIGILSLPFFASKKDLERNIVEVLSNIINIFTVVFIIFLFVSFFVSRGLTFPLRLITQKIRRTTLSSYNEPLSWNSDDEIGMMVTEYNRMLLNLEESKKALAKSEKESAWREMARQVAHEIKNPLTPMKLTLQHMKRVIEEGRDNGAQEKRLNQITSLLEQIETLSDIATSFSDFAKMPAPQMERLDLSHLVKETINLYNKRELGKIVANIEKGRFIIEGDRNWLGRAISNLIINGFQAVNNPKKARIDVSLYAKAKNVVRVEIKDNGHGIPEHIQDKVFTPNFSTKYTGSGLGLAITRKGVEHANGKIWFHSEEGAGTTFFIEIPLV